jgi:hypothetical protein
MSKCSRRIYLFLAVIAALPLVAAQDVLTIGTTSATPGATITVPVYLRDVTGTALGGGSGTGNRIQGIMLQVTATPSVAGMTIAFEQTGVLQGRTPLYQRGGSGRWIGSYSEAAQPLPFITGTGAPGDRIGTLRITLPAALTGTPSVALAFNPLTTMLSNEAGTVTESLANRHLQLVNGTITLSGSSTSTTLNATPNPSQMGNNVTFTANITSTGTIGGSVIFTESSQIIGSAIVQSGVATWTTSTLTPGSHTISATYEGDASHLPSVSGAVQQTVNVALTAPANVAATATSATNVAVAWSASANATQYEVRRKAAGGSYSLVGTVPGTNFNDPTALAGQTYFYVVRALAPNVSSGDSAADHATTVTFTNNPLVAGTTAVKLAHLTELRTAVNAFRAAAGLAPVAFGDPAPSAVMKAHLEALRTGLQQARQTLGLSPLTFTDAIPVTIKAVHFQELRTAIQ